MIRRPVLHHNMVLSNISHLGSRLPIAHPSVFHISSLFVIHSNIKHIEGNKPLPVLKVKYEAAYHYEYANHKSRE